MALSNSYNYFESYTAASAIATALRRIGSYDPDETINSTEQTNALEALNLILKEWGARGVQVFLTDTMYLFLNSTSGIYTTASNYLAFTHATTQLNGSVASGASTITVDSASSISNSDIILIKLSDNTLFATTVNGAPSGTTVTLTDVTTGAASDNGYVYTFSSTNRFTSTVVNVLSANAITSDSNTLIAPQNGTATNIAVVGDVEYHQLSNKHSTGVPTVVMHRRKPTFSEFYVWPRGVTSNVDRIELVCALPIQDMDGTTNNFYVPQEAHNALIWQLAAELASEYGISEAEQRRLWATAESKFQQFLDGYREDASVIFSMDVR